MFQAAKKNWQGNDGLSTGAVVGGNRWGRDGRTQSDSSDARVKLGVTGVPVLSLNKGRSPPAVVTTVPSRVHSYHYREQQQDGENEEDGEEELESVF